MTPFVSVLMPLYNSRQYIGAAIESVLDQTYRNFEIIVVDDGSTDEGARMVEAYPKVRLFRQEHGGISRARNFALSMAGGELIAFLDSDDLWVPEKLALQVDYLETHSECGIVFSRFRNFSDIPLNQMTQRQKELFGAEFTTYLPSACIRKSLFDRFGLFHEDCVFGEDTEWVARLRLARIDLGHCLEEELYMRRVHGGNVTLTHPDMDESGKYSIMARAIREKWRRERIETSL
ncbi:MAG: glycosyltransferase family 2 protein [bacterium]